jgi:hypothetical protein
MDVDETQEQTGVQPWERHLQMAIRFAFARRVDLPDEAPVTSPDDVLLVDAEFGQSHHGLVTVHDFAVDHCADHFVTAVEETNASVFSNS